MPSTTASIEHKIAETKDEKLQNPADHLITIFDRVTQRQPNDIAVVSLHQKDYLGVGTLRWTYAQLRDGSIHLAHQLSAAGLQRESRIAAFLHNEIEWSLVFLASARLGCHFVPLDPRTLNQSADAVYVLSKLSVESIFVSHHGLSRIVEDALDSDLRLQVRLKCVISDHVETQPSALKTHGWTSLAALMNYPCPATTQMVALDRNDTIIMLCTSGTTSQSKICPHTSVTMVTPAFGLADDWSLSREDTLCQHLPTFHVFSVALTLAFWVSGGTVVFPSADYNTSASFDGLASGSKVYIPCVPAMVHAMHTHLMTVDEILPKPFAICLGGAPITPETLLACKALGAKRIVAGYGTTEGVATLFNTMDVNDIRLSEYKSGDNVCLGTAKGGTHLRICAPGNCKPLRRGEIGELHQGGYPVFDGYLHGTVEDNTACYKEGAVSWFATGDRGYMDDEGCIYLLGRYKDLIIRGGENISPLKIEQYLCGHSEISTAIVIGVPDGIIGEVPVAIVETHGNPSETLFEELSSAVILALGRSFAPKWILHLQIDLGCEKLPTTSSGKVKKIEVKKLVLAYLCNSQSNTRIAVIENISPESGSPVNKITEHLTACWSAVSGLYPQKIKPETPIRTFADSIMLIQFLDVARKKGWKLTLKDLLVADTIQKQAQMLQIQVDNEKSRPAIDHESKSSPKGPNPDMKHEMRYFNKGLKPNDVKELIPMTDVFSLMAMDRPFPGAWEFRIPFHIRRSLDADEVFVVLVKWLQRHELLHSKVADFECNKKAYAVMHLRQSWIQRQVIRGPEVADVEAVKTYQLQDHLDPIGPLCKLTVLPIRGTPSCGLVLQIHHVIFDGFVLNRWLQDLNHLFDGQPRLKWQPYRDFATAYEAYRSTPEAHEAVEFFARKLRGISLSRDSLLHLDQSMERENSLHFKRLAETKIIGPGHAGYTRTLLSSKIHLPQLHKMQSLFGITAPVIALAACSLVNVRHTGTSEAIFVNVLSGRSWPLADDRKQTPPSNLMEIDGPTITYPTARLPIIREEATIKLLTRLRDDQDLTMVHAHAPIYKVYEQLSEYENGKADVAMIRDLFHGQMFDWLLSAFTVQPEDALEPIGTTQLSPTAWLWMPRLMERNFLQVDLFHQYPNMPENKARCVLNELLSAAAWLAEPENAGKSISQCEYARDCCPT